MACVAVYQVGLEDGRMRCLSEGRLENREGLLYDGWFQTVLKPWISDRDWEKIEGMSPDDLRGASKTGKIICLHVRKQADRRWVELRTVVEQGSPSIIMVIEDIHDLLVCERRKKRLDVYHSCKTRMEQLRKKGLTCGMLVLDMDNRYSFRFMEAKVMQYLENYVESEMIKNLQEHIIKFLLKKMPEENSDCPRETDCLDINIGRDGENHWIQLYSRGVITERGRFYQYLLYIDFESGQDRNEIHLHMEQDKGLTVRSEGYLFEWNIEDNKMTLPEDWDHVFLAKNSEKRNRRANPMEEYVWKEDRPQLRRLFNSILSKENQDGTIVRLRLNGEGKLYAWCSINFIGVFYNDKLPVYAVGMVKNINQKLKEVLESSLENYVFSTEEQAIDIRNNIEAVLTGERADQVHAILVINTEHIIPREDTVGLNILTYQYIQVLTKMAYPHDRVWGDDSNLVLFLDQIGSRTNARNKANRIIQMIERVIGKQAAIDIGIAMYPEDGKNCTELIRAAREELWNGSRVVRALNNLGNHEEDDTGTVQPVISDIVGEWSRMVRVNKLLEEKMKMTEAELMLSQIKPHFIYNVLANIKSLIHQDPERAENILVIFTRFLRIQLDAIGKNEPVPFSQCLQFALNYVEIEQSRFPGKFKLNFDIEYDDFSMPHFILQPLVENAIKHGAMKKNGLCNITISSRLEGEHIVVKVEDDGGGLNLEQKLNGEGGIGLKNIRARISCLMHGTFQILDRSEGGTVAVIQIPMEKQRGGGDTNDYDSGR